jgi:hypothetical protein
MEQRLSKRSRGLEISKAPGQVTCPEFRLCVKLLGYVSFYVVVYIVSDFSAMSAI